MIEYRIANTNDAAAIHAIYAPYANNTVISFELVAPDVSEMARRIKHTLESYPYLVAVEDGEVIGYAYASKFRERAAYRFGSELSVYVDERRHGRGVGKGLYSRLIALLRAQGIQRVYGCITYPNEKSVSMHESFGFTRVCIFESAGYKFGRSLDILWMELFTGDGDYTKEPVPFANLDCAVVTKVLEAI